MHIAWLGKKSPFCGNVTYSREVTNALLDRGYQVSFLHFAQEAGPLDRNTTGWNMANGSWGKGIAQTSYTNSLSPASCNEVSLPCHYKSQIYTIPTLKSRTVLMKSLRRLKPDVVHASLTLSPLDFLLPEICQELNLPLVATFHPPFDRKLRNLTSGTQHLMYQLYAPFLANYDSTIVFSYIQRDILVRLGVPEERVAVIPNGVDAVKYSPGPSGLKSELKADRIFVYQGRIAQEKNVEALLKAWKQCNFGPGNVLAIVGDGPLAASLQLFFGEDDGIVWLGFVAEEERRIEILRGADVFILPSLVEGLSLSLLEAMACGLACLATDAGADGEALEEGAGIVLNTQRVRSQLQTLLPLFCDHPELGMLLGQKARQRAMERYTLSQNITELEKLYSEVLQKQRVPIRGLA
ncbi:glycosyltransferase family 1 protein [Microcoleus vaginatus PCC 9802]|uniref:glycosyltransferase family 4 protein n=1 Tax=Microcoleus vaginatus TaxID=119532 RepID=UPI00020D11D9|nr:glycosyl transferase group 1 [Microcoleus vaginatus FGP-2]UNU18333.1 glycosyltransferase family 1 protein [Microcoleus vaginatus PCC 9802]